MNMEVRTVNKKKIPVGIDDFKKLRSNDFYYVDKTGMIIELLNNWGAVNLFTRPRRFGKSINMSMLQNFFEIGANESLFDGLDISKEKELCDQYMGKYPVIFISLKQVSGDTFEDAKIQLWSEIACAAEKLDYLQDSDVLNARDKKKIFDLSEEKGNLEESLRLMSRMMCKHHKKQVIILIDEYDAPLQRAYEKNYYNEMVSLIRQMFGYALKSNDYMFFSVLTGCMRISKESIFSDLNNPIIHSISDEQFDEWFGFTDSEVREMLESYDLEQFYDTTREWYDGYKFGRQNVYCPWDVINWCGQLINTSDREPKNYWANTGRTDIISDFAEKADSTTRDEIGNLIEGKSVIKKINQELTYRDMTRKPENIWTLLYTSGYLTMKEKNVDGSYELCIPNRELKNIFISKVDEWFSEKVLNDNEALNKFFSAFTAGDAKTLEDCLNYQLGESISFVDGGDYEDKETFYHGLLLGMLNTRKGWEIKSNREAGDGRADIAAYNFNTKEAYIVEVKYVKTKDELEQATEKALGQICDNRYDLYFSSRQVTILRHYGISFCKKQCRVMMG